MVVTVNSSMAECMRVKILSHFFCSRSHLSVEGRSSQDTKSINKDDALTVFSHGGASSTFSLIKGSGNERGDRN